MRATVAPLHGMRACAPIGTFYKVLPLAAPAEQPARELMTSVAFMSLGQILEQDAAGDAAQLCSAAFVSESLEIP